MEQQVQALREEDRRLTLAAEEQALQRDIARKRMTSTGGMAAPPDGEGDGHSHGEEGQRGREERRSKKRRKRRDPSTESEHSTSTTARHREGSFLGQGDQSSSSSDGTNIYNPSYTPAEMKMVKFESTVKIKDPPVYNGKTIKEHTDWVRACSIAFDNRPVSFKYGITRVRWSSQYLGQRPAELWARYQRTKGKNKTKWGPFKKLLLDWVQTTANRSLAAAEKYETAIQGPTQGVRSFHLHLETIEDALPSYIEAHKMQHFLAKLRLEIC